MAISIHKVSKDWLKRNKKLRTETPDNRCYFEAYLVTDQWLKVTCKVCKKYRARAWKTA